VLTARDFALKLFGQRLERLQKRQRNLLRAALVADARWNALDFKADAPELLVEPHVREVHLRTALAASHHGSPFRSVRQAVPITRSLDGYDDQPVAIAAAVFEGDDDEDRFRFAGWRPLNSKPTLAVDIILALNLAFEKDRTDHPERDVPRNRPRVGVVRVPDCRFTLLNQGPDPDRDLSPRPTPRGRARSLPPEASSATEGDNFGKSRQAPSSGTLSEH